MMEFKINKYTPGTRPEVQLPTTKMFEILGEEGIRNMVGEHYDLLAESPVKNLFPPSGPVLENAKEHTSDFFIQITGGPMFFSKKRGKPMLYKRHLPHKITPEAREVWLQCYSTVLEQLNLPEEVAESFWNYLDKFSFWMINS